MTTATKFSRGERVQMSLSAPPFSRGDVVKITSVRFRGNNILYAVECIKSDRKAHVVEQALTAI